MRKHVVMLSLALLTIFPPSAPSHAGEKVFGFTGYVRNFLTHVDTPRGSTLEAFARLRIGFRYAPSPAMNGELAFELAPLVREHRRETFPLPAPEPLSYRVLDLDATLHPQDDDLSEKFLLFQNLDRAFLTVTARSFDLYIGRQPIAFGSARAINPTDILAPFTYDTLVKEERIGVDAIRFRAPTGRLGELDLGLVFGEDFDASESAAFVRAKSHVIRTDAALMVMYFRENLLFGLDLARSVGGAGAWLEAAYVISGEGGEENYLALSVGADYSITDDLYASMEYHYNGAGGGQPADYLDNLTDTAYQDGAVYLLGRHYLAPGVTYQLSPLLVLSARMLINLNDGSVLASPMLDYNLAEDVYLALGAFLGRGDDPRDSFLPESEFGLYDDVSFVSLSIYF